LSDAIAKLRQFALNRMHGPYKKSGCEYFAESLRLFYSALRA